jgi:uncharacterized protein (TIGR00730 family)
LEYRGSLRTDIMSAPKVITIFGNARVGKNRKEYIDAVELGKLLAQSGFVVCNGGYGGIMEASAKGAKSYCGKTIGVTVQTFTRMPNQFLDEIIPKPNLLERLQKLIELGDAYVVYKGGTGTLVELALSWEYMNKGLMKEKPIIIIGNFWKPVVKTLKEELAWEGLENCTKYITQVDSPAECVNLLQKKFC